MLGRKGKVESIEKNWNSLNEVDMRTQSTNGARTRAGSASGNEQSESARKRESRTASTTGRRHEKLNRARPQAARDHASARKQGGQDTKDKIWAIVLTTAIVAVLGLLLLAGCANHAVERFCENVRLYQNELIIENPELTPAQTKAFEKALKDDDALFELAEMLRDPLIVANPRLSARQKELWLITLYQALGYDESEIMPFIERYRAIIAKQQAQTQTQTTGSLHVEGN